MRPDQLRATLAQKQRDLKPEITPNGIDFYTDPKQGKVMFRFHHQTNNFMLDRPQLKAHIDALILSAKDLGIPFTGEIKWE